VSRPVTAVHVDLARLSYEYSKVSLESAESAESLQRARAAWIDDLVTCLLLRDPSLSAYGAHLLAEVEEYRKAETVRKKKKSDSTDSADSKESADSVESQPRSDRADRSKKSSKKKIRSTQGGRSSGTADGERAGGDR
jgi:hypothetical protein